MIRAVDPLISLPATDPARAHRFYTEVLGLQPVVESPEEGIHIFRGPDAPVPLIGIHQHDGALPAADAQGVWCGFRVGRIEPVRERLAAAGVRFLGEPTADRGPGRELRFLDSEGNVLRLHEAPQDLRRSVRVQSPANAVFRALTDPDMLERWLSPIDDVALEVRVGGAVSFTDPDFGTVRGTITALEVPRRIAFEFTENWPRTLEIMLSPVAECTNEGNCTDVAIVQGGFDAVGERKSARASLLGRLDEAVDTLQQVMLASE